MILLWPLTLLVSSFLHFGQRTHKSGLLKLRRSSVLEASRSNYVVGSLSHEYATEVRDLILAPPEDTPYDVLKEQLVQRTAASDQRRLQQLFNTEQLGDRKPTQLLRRMNQLLGDNAAGTAAAFLRELFLQRLPANVRMVLTSTPQTVSLVELAALADRVVEVAAPRVAEIDAAIQRPSELSQLKAEVARLKRLRGSRRSHSRDRSSSPAGSRPSTSDLCWYHQRYGNDARKCKSPCTKSENAQASR